MSHEVGIMGVRRIFSREGDSGFFQRQPKKFFQIWLKLAKFHFSLSKLGKQRFFAKNVIGKCHISKPKGPRPPCPPSDAHGWYLYAVNLSNSLEGD